MSDQRLTLYTITGVVEVSEGDTKRNEVLMGCLLATSVQDAQEAHADWMARVRPGSTVVLLRAIPIPEADVVHAAARILHVWHVERTRAAAAAASQPATEGTEYVN